MGFTPISPFVGGAPPLGGASPTKPPPTPHPQRPSPQHARTTPQCIIMSRRKDKKHINPTADTPPMTAGPWLSMRTGLTGMSALSLTLGGWTAWQVHLTRPWGESLLWGLGFALAIWLVFGLAFAFTSRLRR
ncbi:MAG: hypothetical protein Fur0018_22240 [Anaerolineales bacterium]